jgi:hypothetical protein
MSGSFLEDDLSIFTNIDEFGTEGTWTAEVGSAVTVNGIFEDLQIEIDPFTGVIITNAGIFFTCAKSDVPDIKQGEPIVIEVEGSDETFLVKNVPQSSRSHHTIKLELRRQ